MQEANKAVNILIVEDSLTQAEQLKYLLETNGYAVTMAANAKEAFSVLSSHKPTLIISDIIMPEMDGYQLCKQIKTDEKLKDIPVILLTVLSDARDVLKGLECNADNFITKPYNEKYLLSRIHHILINRELRKSEKVQLGVEVFFSGQKFLITSEKQQILDLLLSTYEIAVQQNSDLTKTRDELKALNENLEEKVKERTAMLQMEIEERKRVEMGVRRVNRTLEMLSGCNEALVRAEKESDLLSNICRIIVEVGGYRLAWVGFAEHDEEKTVRPASQAGFDDGYLDRVKITWSDTESGRGPTGKAIRTGKPCIVSDIHTDPDYLPWRDEALKHGYLSSIVFPLIADGQDGKVFGSLSIYASKPNAFQDEEVKILSELASDLSYGILTLRIREERKRAGEELNFRNVILSTQQEASIDGILVVNESNTIISYNQQFVEMWGIPPKLLESKNDEPVLQYVATKPIDREGFLARVKYLYERREEKSQENIALKDGRVFERYSAPMLGSDGRYYGRVWYFRDITDRKQMEEKMQYLAYHDVLTGLPNRNLFLERINQEIAEAKDRSSSLAVVLMDINKFKSICDMYGPEVGDTVLKEVAERLSTAVRKGDTVAHLESNEFGVACMGLSGSDDIIMLEKIIKDISYPFKINEEEIILTLSSGISLYPHDGGNASELLKSAGLALSIAEKEGKKTSRFYTKDMTVTAAEVLLLEKQLIIAIKNEEFILHYQPYWDITTKKMVGMEALIRWQSKDKGLVPPGKFIPMLEDTGMIIEVGEWILREAMRQVKEWENNGHPVVPVSVNMSLVQFRQKDLAGMVKRIMAERGFYPSLLTLEITESAFMQDIEFTRSVLTEMKRIGCSVSIDDFGTGYSSMAYLKKFPIDNLKIDISFIRELVQDPDSASIVMAIINMAHTLNLKTIAEGIETEEQWNFLRLLRCDMGQGFYLSKPLPAKDVEKLFNVSKF